MQTANDSGAMVSSTPSEFQHFNKYEPATEGKQSYLVRAGQRFLKRALLMSDRQSPALRSPQSRGSPCRAVYPPPSLILPVIPGSIAT